MGRPDSCTFILRQTQAHQIAQGMRLERLGQYKIRTAVLRQKQRVGLQKPCAARHGDYFKRRITAAQVQNGLDSFLLRHDYIHENKIVIFYRAFDFRNRLAPVCGLCNSIAGTPQDKTQRKPHLRIVVDHQNIFRIRFHLFILRRKDYPNMKRGIACRCIS